MPESKQCKFHIVHGRTRAHTHTHTQTRSYGPSWLVGISLTLRLASLASIQRFTPFDVDVLVSVYIFIMASLK